MASIQVQGKFQTSSFKVFDYICLRCLALKRALGFTARFGWCVEYWLDGAALAPRAGAGTEPGVDGQPPQRAKAGFQINQTIITKFYSIITHLLGW